MSRQLLIFIARPSRKSIYARLFNLRKAWQGAMTIDSWRWGTGGSMRQTAALANPKNTIMFYASSLFSLPSPSPPP